MSCMHAHTHSRPHAHTETGGASWGSTPVRFGSPLHISLSSARISRYWSLLWLGEKLRKRKPESDLRRGNVIERFKGEQLNRPFLV